MIVFIDGKKMTIPVPAQRTLKKYGLTLIEWKDMISETGYRCPICERVLATPVVDHLHVRNWRKMKQDKRKKYIRGIPCNYCNRRRLARGMNLQIARNIVKYLEAFEKRLNNATETKNQSE